MQLKGEVGGHALNSQGNYFVNHEKSWKNNEIVFLNFCGKPATRFKVLIIGHSNALAVIT